MPEHSNCRIYLFLSSSSVNMEVNWKDNCGDVVSYLELLSRREMCAGEVEWSMHSSCEK